MKIFVVKSTETLRMEKSYRVDAESSDDAVGKVMSGDVSGVESGRFMGIDAREIDAAGIVELSSPSSGGTDASPGGIGKLEIADREAARRACKILVEAYASNPEDVDWSDVQASLAEALNAFGLPEDYPEKVWQDRLARENPDESEDDETVEASVMSDLGL